MIVKTDLSISIIVKLFTTEHLKKLLAITFIFNHRPLLNLNPISNWDFQMEIKPISIVNVSVYFGSWDIVSHLITIIGFIILSFSYLYFHELITQWVIPGVEVYNLNILYVFLKSHRIRTIYFLIISMCKSSLKYYYESRAVTLYYYWYIVGSQDGSWL